MGSTPGSTGLGKQPAFLQSPHVFHIPHHRALQLRIKWVNKKNPHPSSLGVPSKIHTDDRNLKAVCRKQPKTQGGVEINEGNYFFAWFSPLACSFCWHLQNISKWQSPEHGNGIKYRLCATSNNALSPWIVGNGHFSTIWWGKFTETLGPSGHVEHIACWHPGLGAKSCRNAGKTWEEKNHSGFLGPSDVEKRPKHKQTTMFFLQQTSYILRCTHGHVPVSLPWYQRHLVDFIHQSSTMGPAKRPLSSHHQPASLRTAQELSWWGWT